MHAVAQAFAFAASIFLLVIIGTWAVLCAIYVLFLLLTWFDNLRLRNRIRLPKPEGYKR